MKKVLTRVENTVYYYKDGKRIGGTPPGLWGDVSGLRGNVSGLWGDVTGLWGNVSGLWGNLDLISKEDREKDNNIESYIK